MIVEVDIEKDILYKSIITHWGLSIYKMSDEVILELVNNKDGENIDIRVKKEQDLYKYNNMLKRFGFYIKNEYNYETPSSFHIEWEAKNEI